MSEPTLNMAFKELRGDVGFYAGYSRGEDFGENAWTDNQARTIAAVMKAGLHMFYNCGYDWSFLKPVASVTLASGASTVQLPDDFGSASGQVMFSNPDGSSCIWALVFGPLERVYEYEARFPDATGCPLYLCEEPIKGTTGTEGQRHQIHVAPAADQAYTLKFQYRLNLNALTGALPYAYGGPQHAQTLLQACKAAFERDVDGITEGTPPAAQQAAFAKQLEASMKMDRRNKPQSLGPNRDYSDRMRGRGLNGPYRTYGPISIQGTIY